MSQVVQLKSELEARISAANDLDQLEKIRVEALGKKGAITGLMQNLGTMEPDARKTFGAEVNALKDTVTRLLEDRFKSLKEASINARLAAEKQDMTLPVATGAQGKIHPISQTIDEMIAIFADMGFTVAEGPDVEDDGRIRNLRLEAVHVTFFHENFFERMEKPQGYLETDAPSCLEEEGVCPGKIEFGAQVQPPVVYVPYQRDIPHGVSGSEFFEAESVGEGKSHQVDRGHPS